MDNKPKIAILQWEQGKVPEGLRQLEMMPGNSTNPKSFPFPIRLVPVPGAGVETVITNPSKKLLADMIQISKQLIEKEGIRAISTSCGFNAIFQRELSEALTVPVLTSSLMQVPFVQAMIGHKKTIGVITANKGSLTEEHMKSCGITEDMNVVVFGLEGAKEWSKIFEKPDEPFDMQSVEKEIVSTAIKGIEVHPEIAAIVLECTDLPPFAKKISEATGVPVFDFVSMLGYMSIVLGEVKMY